MTDLKKNISFILVYLVTLGVISGLTLFGFNRLINKNGHQTILLDQGQIDGIKDVITKSSPVINFDYSGSGDEVEDNGTYNLGSTFIQSRVNTTSTNAVTTNITWTNATGTKLNFTSATGTNLYLSSYLRSAGLMMTANNTYDIGSGLNSAKNIYSSGTIFSVNQIVSGNVTTTGLETGSFVSTPDAGYIPLFNALISGTATNTRQGAYFAVGGTPIFGFNCLSDGAGACKTSSTRLTVYAPMNCPVSATTTVATSTVLGLESGCYEVIGSNVGTTIQTQLFATTTVMSIGGTEICISGTSDTSTVTIADTAEVHTSGGVAKVLGDGDEWCGKYMYSRNYWKESSYVDN